MHFCLHSQPFACTQWNDKDLDALLDDSDDEDSKSKAPPLSLAASGFDDDRQASKIAESVAAIRIGAASQKKTETKLATSQEMRAELDSLPLSGLYARSLEVCVRACMHAYVRLCACAKDTLLTKSRPSVCVYGMYVRAQVRVCVCVNVCPCALTRVVHVFVCVCVPVREHVCVCARACMRSCMLGGMSSLYRPITSECQ